MLQTVHKRVVVYLLALTVTSIATATIKTASTQLPLVISVCSHNSAPWVEQNLDSIFAQNYQNFKVVYVDDASTDNTAQLVEEYISKHNLHNKITCIINRAREGKLKNVYNVVHECDDQDIIIQIDGDDWLPHNNVFKRIEQAYKDEDIWLTYSDFHVYPEGTKEWCTPMPVPNHIVAKGSYRNWKWVFTHIRTFYAWLYKTIKLEDLIAETSPGFKGKFFPICNDMAAFFPMLEMCGPHFAFIPEKLYVYNRGNPNLGAKLHGHLYKPIGEDIRKRAKYQKLEKPILDKLDAFDNAQADLIILSTNTTNALTRLLTSLEQHVTGLNTITVLYQKNKREFKELIKHYPQIQFIQSTNSSTTTTLHDIITKSSQNHIVLAKDTIIVHEPINLHDSIMALEKTGAHAVYLKFAHGKHPFYSPVPGTELVPHQHVCQNLYTWKFSASHRILYNNIDMTLFNKQTLLERLALVPDTNSIFSFFTTWRDVTLQNLHHVGLFYDSTKISNNLMHSTAHNNNLYETGASPRIQVKDYVTSLLQYHASMPTLEKTHISFNERDNFKETLKEAGEHHYGYFIGFDAAMICNQHDIKDYQAALESDAKNAQFFDFARKQYTKYIIEQPEYSHSPRIPKIIHQIWVGPKTPPAHFKKWQETLLKLHPGWTYKLWTDKDVAQLSLINQRHYDAEVNYGAKADILRLELLNQFGGVYVDIDFECLKPFDPLHHLCDFYIGFFQAIYMRGRARMNNGLIAAKPGHPIIKVLIEEIGKNRDQYADLTSWSGILARNGPDFVTRILHTYLPRLDGINIVFPSNYFYPWTGAPKNLQLRVQPETIAIHYFASSWDPKVQDLPHLQQGK